jgi:uncharacterized heparinase superfamily protein
MALGPGFPAGTTGTNETDRSNGACSQQANTAILNSLAVQADWLRRRLEHHLLGNHLFANAKALVFAGAFFVGPEAKRWLRLGQRLLRRELDEQILPDGGHFERSPMYHAILLEDVLDVLRLGQVYPDTLDAALLRLCREKAAAMRDWLAAMTHPDGEISFFNDAALGIAPSVAQLERYAQAVSSVFPVGKPESTLGTGNRAAYTGHSACHSGLDATALPRRTEHPLRFVRREAGSQAREGRLQTTPTLIWLRDSGYVRLEAGPAVALLDVAPIGPDYLPGHAHADTLSFELSLYGQRVIVNGGTSRYGSGPERLAERGTASHSTVQIDGADSSEVWGGFRVARRARPFALKMGPSPILTQLPFVLSAAHDGYRRLPGKPVHRRQWRLSEDCLVVTDRIEGDYRSAVARFHLHPQVEASIEGACGSLRLPDGTRVRWQASGGHPRLVSDTWHSEFGRSVPSQCLEVVMASDQSALELSWPLPGPASGASTSRR